MSASRSRSRPRPPAGLYEGSGQRLMWAVGVAFLFEVAPKLAVALLAYGLMAAVVILIILFVLNGLN